MRKTLSMALGALSLLFVSCGGKPDTGLVVQSYVEMTQTNLNAQLSGKIQTVSVKEGDAVHTGQVLLVQDNQTLQAQLVQAKARIVATQAQKDSALAAKDLAESSYQRLKQMWDKGAITKGEFDDVTAKLRQATAGLEATNAQLDLAQGALSELNSYMDKTTLTSPTEGVVTQVNVEAGEVVSPGMPLVVVTDLRSPWIQCSVPETKLSLVRLGQDVKVKLAAYPGKSYPGKVTRINKDADFAVKRATNDNGEFDVVSYGVKVEVTGIDQPLYAGMTAFVDFGK